MKKIGTYLAFPLLVILILLLYGFSLKRNQQKKVQKIEVQFEGGENEFLTHESVNKLLIQNNEEFKNQPKSVIDLHELENLISANPYVEEAVVFLTPRGLLKTQIKQREPLARIITNNESYYIDKYGVKIPLSSNHSARVPLVLGVNSFKDVKEITQLVNYFFEDDFLKKEIVAMKKMPNDEYVFNVRSGDYKINFGKCVNIDKKIKKIKAFYNKALLDKTIHNYKTINVKYHNQVVCTKQHQVGKAKSLGVKRGVVNNITQTIQSIQQAVDEAESVSGQKIEEVVVGIAGQHIRSLHHSDYITRTKSDEVIEAKDINDLENQVHKLVMLPGEEIIHVLPQEFKVDSQADIKEPIGMYGGRLEANFHVVVGQVSSIRNIGRCVKSAGLSLSDITLEPLASASAVLSREEKEAGVALIDIGGGTTDLAIFKDGIIRHTAVIPFGGNVITEDIKEGCSIIEKQAELLKVKFGSAWPGENKETEIVSIPGEHVYLEIKNYGHETQKGKLIAGIVLTGGGSQLKHLRQLVEYITGMDARIGFPNENLAGESDDNLSSPSYATAVGLLMEGLSKPEIERVVEEKVVTEASFQPIESVEKESIVIEDKQVEPKRRAKSFFDKFTERFKEFLDNAE